MARNTKVEADHNAPPITQILAKFVATHPSRGWSDAVGHEAHRTFLNWVGCAVGAAKHESAEAALGGMRMLQPAPQAAVLGRAERVDMASAALVNGITSHTFDFDDTHLKTIIHPAGPVASALLALAEVTGASGRQVIDALVLGIDVACRMGNCLYPEHYDRGWHITGSTGTLGAAAGCARLMGLDERHTAWALGVAASQPIGMREQFGSMTKPFHPGAAARAGLTSALIAKHGFTASAKALEAPRGFAQVVSPKHDWNEITGELGSRFEISFNTYKPFAVRHRDPPDHRCAHAAARAGREGRGRGARRAQGALAGARAHRQEGAAGRLQAKFSVYHGFAAGLIFGQAAETEYDDHIVTREDMVALRRKVVATSTIPSTSVADVTAVLKDGRRVHVFVEHAIGSLERPLSDQRLEAKFHMLADPVIGSTKADALIKACWNLSAAKDVKAIVEGATP
jgi:2-methylcitrate dehydratase PrpD